MVWLISHQRMGRVGGLPLRGTFTVFGVILLELVTGKEPIGPAFKKITKWMAVDVF